MDTEEPKDAGDEVIKRSLDLIGEHYDTVQIFCTRHDEGGKGGTVHTEVGSGNWYARTGQVQEWLTKNSEIGKQEVRKRED